MRYLKTYESFEYNLKYNRKDESVVIPAIAVASSIGWAPIAAVGALAVLGIAGGYYAFKKFYGGSESTPPGGIKLSGLLGSTSDTKCFNETLEQFGLPKTKGNGSDDRYFVGTVGDLQKAISEKDPSKILSNFKLQPRSSAKVGGNDLTDYLKVGDKEITNEGGLSFNFIDPNTKIVASGNCLLALTRIVRAAIKSPGKYEVARVELKTTRENDGFNFQFTPDFTSIYSRNYFTFQAGITTTEKFNTDLRKKAEVKWGKDSPKLKSLSIANSKAPSAGVAKLIGASEVEIIKSIKANIVALNSTYIPVELYGGPKDFPRFFDEISTKLGFEVMSDSDIKKYLDEFRRKGDVDIETMEKFNNIIKEQITNNVTKFSEEYLGSGKGEEVSKKVKNYLKYTDPNVTFKEKCTGVNITNVIDASIETKSAITPEKGGGGQSFPEGG